MKDVKFVYKKYKIFYQEGNAMDVRYSANQKDVKRYTTEELRKEFLIQDLYAPNEVHAVYSHVDRMVTLGCMPTTETVSIDKGIDCWKNFGILHSLLL